jgi:hypothetical protein
VNLSAQNQIGAPLNEERPASILLHEFGSFYSK